MNIFTWLIDKFQKGNITQGRPASNGNEGVATHFTPFQMRSLTTGYSLVHTQDNLEMNSV